MTPSLFEAPALTAPALLESLARRGAVVSLAGAAGDRRLHVAPRDVLTDDDRAEIRRLKPDLIALLESPESAPAHRWPNESPDVPRAPPFAAPDGFTATKSASATTGSAAAPDVLAWAAPGLTRQQQWRAARLDGQRQARERRANPTQSANN